MAHSQRNRMRKVALTGILAPSLVLSIVGIGSLPAGAESVTASGPCTAFAPATAAPAQDMSVADVAEKLNPAVVTILNMQPLSQASMNGLGSVSEMPEMPGIDQLPGVDELPGAEGSQQATDTEDSDTIVPVGSGSGFIVDELGHTVTNAHVVDGATELLAVLQDGTEIPATVVGADSIIDVAILKLDFPSDTTIPAVASFGDSQSLRAGDEVVAIGTALGAFPNTVSEGTVNAVNRAFPGEGGLSDLIQHDAEIWHGNSGGPLLNLRGEVVGINTAGIGGGSPMSADSSSADMAFAVDGNTICKAAAALLNDGEIVWPYLGIERDPQSEDITIAELVEDGPAAVAGIETGDVITAFDGATLDNQNSLMDLLFAREPGDTVEVTVDRDGAAQTFQVTLGERPEETQ